MNLHENIFRIKQMIGTNKSVVPFQLFGITERLIGYKTAHFALYAHLFNKLYDAYEKGNLEEEYSILINDNKSNKKMVKYFYDFIINNNEYFENKEVFTENNMKKIIKLTESDLIRIINKVINESDPKTGTGKKPQGSDRRLYTDENPSDTVSVKFKTKEDIVDTLNKESFKSKPHKRQSQIINLIHQRVRAAYQNASDPETKKRLKRGLDYIEGEKERSKKKTLELQKEGLLDTSWENDEGDKVTLMDLLTATEEIPVSKVSVNKLKKHLLTWDGDEEEVKKIESADLQYPILIFVEDDGSFISIIDGHHRAQKAVRRGLETIKAKIIPINSLPKNIRKVFSYMGKQEEMKEGELTEKCWAGYTQKGMKTMFGKKYPNCVKIKKK